MAVSTDARTVALLAGMMAEKKVEKMATTLAAWTADGQAASTVAVSVSMMVQ